MKKLGILGGMGPMATADFYQKVVVLTHVNSELEHIQMFIDSNPAIPDRTAYLTGQGDSPLNELVKGIKRLETAGSDLIAMPCNTAHHFYKTLCEHTALPIINMVEETLIYTLDLIPSKKIGLLATKGTYASGIYEATAQKFGVDLYCPDAGFQQILMEAIYALKNGRLDALPALKTEIYKHMDAVNLEGWILGCTELPIILKDRIDHYPLIDSTYVLARASVLASGATLTQK